MLDETKAFDAEVLQTSLSKEDEAKLKAAFGAEDWAGRTLDVLGKAWHSRAHASHAVADLTQAEDVAIAAQWLNQLSKVFAAAGITDVAEFSLASSTHPV